MLEDIEYIFFVQVNYAAEHSDEREKLIKKTDKNGKGNWRKYRKGNNDQVRDEMSLLLDEVIDEKAIGSFRDYSENNLLINTIKSKRHFTFKKQTNRYLNRCIKLKTIIVQNVVNKYKGWCCTVKYIKPYAKAVKRYDYFECWNLKTCKRRRKQLHQKKKLRRLYNFKVVKRNFPVIPSFKVFQSLNFYDINITTKSVYVSKIKKLPIQSNKFKRGYLKCTTPLNKTNKTSLREINNIETIILAGREFKSCKTKDDKSKNGGNIEMNSLKNNRDSNENIANQNSRDKNEYHKEIWRNAKQNKLTKNKHSFRVQKICNLCCPCIKTNDINPTKEESKECPCSCFKDTTKTNFKRRKKVKKKVIDRSTKNHISKEETVSARNYRLSSYILDENWISQKLCKDPEKERIKKLNVLCDIAKLRLEAADHEDKEARLMKV